MNRRKFLLMSICLVLAGLGIWKSEKEALPPIDPNAGEMLFSGIAPSAIKKLSVVRPGASFAVQQAAGGEWQLRRPEGALADRAKVMQLVKTAAGLKAQTSVERSDVEPDPSVYGLQPPELVLTVEGDFGRRVCSFGKKVKVTGRRYLQLEGEARLFLVDDTAFSALNIEADDVRDHLPIKFDRKKVQELVVWRGENNLLTFTRGEQWKVRSGEIEFPADRELVEAKLDGLLKLKVKRFVDEPGTNLAVFGLELPRVVIQVRSGADAGETAKELTVQVGEGVTVSEAKPGEGTLDAEKGYYIKVSGQPFVYEVGRPFYLDLLQRADYFRPKNPLHFLLGKPIERIEGEITGEPAFTIITHAGEWHIERAGTPPAPASGERVKTWLEDAVNLHVISYPGAEESGPEVSGFQQPDATFKIFVKDRAAPVMLVLGAPVKGGAKQQTGEDTPLWAGVSQEDGALMSSIISADAGAALRKGSEYFGKEN